MLHIYVYMLCPSGFSSRSPFVSPAGCHSRVMCLMCVRGSPAIVIIIIKTNRETTTTTMGCNDDKCTPWRNGFAECAFNSFSPSAPHYVDTEQCLFSLLVLSAPSDCLYLCLPLSLWLCDRTPVSSTESACVLSWFFFLLCSCLADWLLFCESCMCENRYFARALVDVKCRPVFYSRYIESISPCMMIHTQVGGSSGADTSDDTRGTID